MSGETPPHNIDELGAGGFVFGSSTTAEITVPRRLVLGDGSIMSLGGALRGLGVASGAVLVVADAVLVDHGLTRGVEETLRMAGYDAVLFAQSAGEPDLATADAVVSAVRAASYTAVVGFGGGSAMDPAKLAAGLAENDGAVEEYLRGRTIEREALPLALVPTTAGTGAEASKNTIVTHESRKFVIGSPLLCPSLALLDPALTVTCPGQVTAASGMDALAHAIEATLSLWANPFTTLNALAAVRTISRWLRPAYEDGSNEEARRAMLYSAYLAGLSINASTLLGHTMAYTIATRSHLPHGVTTAMSLPYCIAYNAPAAAERIRMLATEAGEGRASLAGWVRRLADDLGMPPSLQHVGLGENDLPEMVEECFEKYPRPNNPFPFERARLLELYGYFVEGDIDGATHAMLA